MTEAIGQLSPRMKPANMYELRVPSLNKEVEDVRNQVIEMGTKGLFNIIVWMA